LPYAFASHFAPALLDDAVDLYRRRFQPSMFLERSHLMIGLHVCAADTDAAARRQFTSVQQAVLNLRRGRPGPLPPPRDDFAPTLASHERDELERIFACAVVGGPERVRDGLQAMLHRT